MIEEGNKYERVGGRVMKPFDPDNVSSQGISNAVRRDMGLDRADDDPVNHPSHYKQYTGFEVIDITEQLNFNRGNAVKYILRAGFKDDEMEDLRKAQFYINREIERLEKKNASRS